MAKRNGGQCIIAFNYVRQGQGAVIFRIFGLAEEAGGLS